MYKNSSVQRVYVTRPSSCLVVNPLRPGGTLSLVSGVNMVTAMGLHWKPCRFDVTIGVNGSWLSCYVYSLIGGECVSLNTCLGLRELGKVVGEEGEGGGQCRADRSNLQ